MIFNSIAIDSIHVAPTSPDFIGYVPFKVPALLTLSFSSIFVAFTKSAHD
jgi:hypothetical protein